MIMSTVKDIHIIGERLNDEKLPLKDRFRALFTLRNLGGRESIDCICSCFNDTSVLLKHELAYCLGQMKDTYAVCMLTRILEDENRHVIVRHEAGEALGAIGSHESLSILKRHSHHAVQEIAETCQLAINKIAWLHDTSARCSESTAPNNPYVSVDPAAPSSETAVPRLRATLLDEALPLYDRYSAMFTLRNIGTEDCISALAEGLQCKKSALFRHEIAFVLGQTQKPSCVPQLVDRLRDKQEHPMVRHESAEALGAIATESCIRVLTEYLNDGERIVRESCAVALDISEHELSSEFQYANCLTPS